jgi:hypothetical protein
MMNDFADSIVTGLLRTTLLLAIAGIGLRALAAALRSSSHKTHRIICCLVLLQGWLFVGVTLVLPWYDAPASAALPSSETTRFSAIADAQVVSVESPTVDFKSTIDRPSPAPAKSSAAVAMTPVTATKVSGTLIAATIWLAGMTVLVALSFFSYFRFVRRLPPSQPVDECWKTEWETLLVGYNVRRPFPLHVTADVGPVLCRLPGGYRLLVPRPIVARIDSCAADRRPATRDIALSAR